MKQIIGMAKSYLDLKGSKSRNLELDFLRLANAINKTRAEGREAYGVLLVLREDIRTRAVGWKDKYGISNEIEVVLAQTSPNEDRILKTEKSINANANRPGTSREDARANKSEKIGEDHLRSEIKKRFPGVEEERPDLAHLKCVKWDFCGVVREPVGGAA